MVMGVCFGFNTLIYCFFFLFLFLFCFVESVVDRCSQRQTDDEYNDRNRSTAPAYGNGWENIEKHLSMKKTIRKKMMRDLQQAFIDSQDPPNQQWDQVQMASSYQKTGEPNLLEMLKANPTAPPKSSNMNNMNNVNSMNDNQVELTVTKKPGFWKKLTMRKNKR